MKNLFWVSLSLLMLLTCSPSALFAQRDAAVIGSGKTVEIQPVLNPAATELYFVRPDFKNNQGRDKAADIWMRTRNANGSWNRAVNVGAPINTARADRPLGFSADGNRLAVLRGDGPFHLAILQRDGRGWKSRALAQVPSDVASKEDVAYNLATGELIYARSEGTAGKDFYRSVLSRDGSWSNPEPATELNGATDESKPFFAADGRTLYFFRSGQGWFRQPERGQEPLLTAIPISVKGFSLGLTDDARNSMAVVAINPSLNAGELRGMMVNPKDYPAPGRVVDASTQTGVLNLTSGATLRQIVELGDRTSVFLRTDERIVDGNELSDIDEVGIPVGGLYTDSQITGRTQTTKVRKLTEQIKAYEASLNELSYQRQAVLDQADYDRVLQLEAQILRDTQPRSSLEQARLDEQLREIEAMKAKFNRQQSERQRISDGGSRYRRPTESRAGDPTGRNRSSDPLTTTRQQEALPTTRVNNTSQAASSELAEIRERQRRDSLNRSTAKGTPTPSFYGDNQTITQRWEYDLQRTLPKNPTAIAEATRIDEQYQREQTELEALREELARLRGQQYVNQSVPAYTPPPAQYTTPRYEPARPSSYETPAGNTWEARGGGYAPPVEYRSTTQTRRSSRTDDVRTRTYAPRSTEPGQLIDISFVPNTAYISGEGYGGVEQLYRIIQEARGVVEVRVHTPLDMDRRAAQLLSEERARTLQLELVDLGIAERHFKIFGFGNNETGKGGERVEVRY
ncbi:PD40 domain-containing protein [Lewinella sp. 4G2]|uniref:PD40 domain-containing protein n=1 Tax=Lewinella sp. 4G2 TaxID=1803372 RepID=UPI0012FA4EA1|nr:PD40 domain-containing protein [Lewinella sp. 4G2]